MAISKFVPADLSKTAYFTLRRHATERHHAAPSSQSRWTTAERTMTPAEASLKGVDRPPAIKERTTVLANAKESGYMLANIGNECCWRSIDALHVAFFPG
jgi:hypothetical protein